MREISKGRWRQNSNLLFPEKTRTSVLKVGHFFGKFGGLVEKSRHKSERRVGNEIQASEGPGQRWRKIKEGNA